MPGSAPLRWRLHCLPEHSAELQKKARVEPCVLRVSRSPHRLSGLGFPDSSAASESASEPFQGKLAKCSDAVWTLTFSPDILHSDTP